MFNQTDIRIVEEFSETELITVCAYCGGVGRTGATPNYPFCTICKGRREVGILVEGLGPLKVCIQCSGCGKTGPTCAYPACPMCGGLGCVARAGTLKVVPPDQLRLAAPRPISMKIEKLLSDLLAQVPDLGEREFLAEALKCYKPGAFRAAIVMAWNLAYDHLLNYIWRHRLAEFNLQWPKRFPRQHAQSRVSSIAVRDHFSELKESEVLEICKSAAIISPDVFKVMEEKLGKRNSAAHPTGVILGAPQAENFIHEITNDVVLKFTV